MMDTKQQQTLKQWQWYSDKVILALCEEVGLRPSEIARLRYCDLYEDGKPAKRMVMRPELGQVRGRKDNVVRLSKKLQRALAQLYNEPILFSNRGFCIPVITDRPIARALSQDHVGRIVRRMCNDKVTQTQLGAAMEQMIEDDDPIINEALNAE